MAALREILIAFGMSVDASPLDKAEIKVDGFLGKIKQVGEALAGAFAVKKIFDFEQTMIENGAALTHQAELLGLSTRALSQWRFAAGFADISGEELTGMFTRVSRAANSATDANSEQGKALKKLGVNINDYSTSAEAFEVIGNKLAALQDGYHKTALASQFFGRSGGIKVLELFKGGADGIKKYREEWIALGGGLTDFSKRAREVDDQEKRLNFAFSQLKVQIAGVLLPVFGYIVEKATLIYASFTKLINGTHAVASAFILLGSVAAAKAAMIVVQYAPIIGTFLLWAAAIAFVVLALDDVWGFFTGKNSLIGKAIDELFGKGASDKVREWAGALWDIVKSVGNRIVEIFSNSSTSVFGKFQELIAFLDGVFRTKAKEIFGDIGGDVVSEMASAITEVIGLFVSAADQVRKVFQGIFKFIGEGIASGQDAQLNDQARAQRAEDDRIAKLPPISAADIRGLFAGPNAQAGGGSFFDSNQTVPVRTPAAGGDTVEHTYAPVVNVNVAVAPGTPQAQQQALASSAQRGAAAALTAPNRAAAASLTRTGEKA